MKQQLEDEVLFSSNRPESHLKQILIAITVQNPAHVEIFLSTCNFLLKFYRNKSSCLAAIPSQKETIFVIVNTHLSNNFFKKVSIYKTHTKKTNSFNDKPSSFKKNVKRFPYTCSNLLHLTFSLLIIGQKIFIRPAWHSFDFDYKNMMSLLSYIKHLKFIMMLSF